MKEVDFNKVDCSREARNRRRAIINQSIDVFLEGFYSEMDSLFGIFLSESPEIDFEYLDDNDGSITDCWPGNEGLMTVLLSTEYALDALQSECDKCFNRWIWSRKFTLGHEIAHLYSREINPSRWSRSNGSWKDYSDDAWIVEESLAELSSMFYFYKINRLDEILNFARLSKDYNFGSLAYEIINRNRNRTDNFIRSLCMCDEGEGIRLIESYEKYLGDYYHLSLESYFGTCIHETGRQIVYEKQLSLF